LPDGLCNILLKDLENYIRNHPEARLAKIQEIGRRLVDDGIMPQAVQADVEAITSRWSHLSQQVGDRDCFFSFLSHYDDL
jgi:hypothetical protein